MRWGERERECVCENMRKRESVREREREKEKERERERVQWWSILRTQRSHSEQWKVLEGLNCLHLGQKRIGEVGVWALVATRRLAERRREKEGGREEERKRGRIEKKRKKYHWKMRKGEEAKEEE